MCRSEFLWETPEIQTQEKLLPQKEQKSIQNPGTKLLKCNIRRILKMPDVWAATWEFSGAFGAWTKILPGFLPPRGKKARSDPASAVPHAMHAIHGLARWSGRSRTSAGSSQDLGIEATHWSHPEHSSGDVFMPRPSIQKRLLGKQESGEATHSKTLHQAWAGNPHHELPTRKPTGE